MLSSDQRHPLRKVTHSLHELISDTHGYRASRRQQTTNLYGYLRNYVSLQGRTRALNFDPELLYIGAMFHDLGLNQEFRASGRRFEVDSADEARRFLRSHGVPEDSIRRVWTAIALHTTPGIPQFMEPEVALVTAGVEYDVLGIGYDDITPDDRAAITALHPRPDFKNRILAAFTDGIAPKPETTFGNVKADVLEHFVPGYERGDFVETIRNSAWPE
ncbi:HD domain-containing protein [Streptomyces sp. ISL-96]|uniref:HD domain-containing protein n=1 Tax=Streptomyces sp. ISL-96 TaxID=2819191 RepID=UPI0035ABC4CA